MNTPLILPALALAILGFASCSSPEGRRTQNVTYEQGVPGGTLVETYNLTATVTGIDLSSRKLTLVSPDGKKAVVKCPPEVVNFDRISIGDTVRATVTDELTVAMANAAAAPVASSAAVVAVAPKGAKPAALVAETQEYIATIVALDLKHRRATLKFPDGTSRKFSVRKDVDLSQRKVGESVAIRVTVAMAVSVRKL
jgi:hypothetical protein